MKDFGNKGCASAPAQPTCSSKSSWVALSFKLLLFCVSRAGHGLTVIHNLPAICSPAFEESIHVQNVHFHHRVRRNALGAEEAHESRRTTGWGGLSVPCRPDSNTLLPLPCLNPTWGCVWLWFGLSLGWFFFRNSLRPRPGGAAAFEPRRGP